MLQGIQVQECHLKDNKRKLLSPWPGDILTIRHQLFIQNT